MFNLFSKGELEILNHALLALESQGFYADNRVFVALRKRVVHALAMKIE